MHGSKNNRTVVYRWSEALHGVADSPGVHFGGQV